MSSKNKNYTILYIIIFIVILAILVFIFKDNLFGQKQNQDYNSTSNTSRLAQNSNVLGNTEEANIVNNRIDNVLANAETPPSEKEEEIVIELKVAPTDMGKVIGKQGRIAKAIRSVVKAASSKMDKKVIVEIQ